MVVFTVYLFVFAALLLFHSTSLCPFFFFVINLDLCIAVEPLCQRCASVPAAESEVGGLGGWRVSSTSAVVEPQQQRAAVCCVLWVGSLEDRIWYPTKFNP